MSQAQRNVKVESRRTDVARLYLRGKSQQQIADELEVTRKTVWSDIQAIRAEWKKERLDDAEELINIELAKIDQMEAEAWAAWERSKQPTVQRVVLDADKEGAGYKKRVKTGQTGEPQYLAIVLKCCERRCKILGLDAPAKQESKVDLQIGGPPLTREEMYATVMERIQKLTTPSSN